MTPWLDDGDVRLYHGDCLDVLQRIPERSADCCVTSPPYWGLRDYGHDGQLGLEQTPQEYVARMVDVFREVRRVLRDDGTLWLNLGDSYASSTANGGQSDFSTSGLKRDGRSEESRLRTLTERAKELDRPQPAHRIDHGLKPKDLVGIPWRVAFALQDDGWYLRSDIIWAKPNPMPESVTDRPTKAHEYVFLLSKQPQYFWDQEAIRETYTPDGRKTTTVRSGNGAIGLRGASDRERWAHSGRNVRSVWEIATQPFPGAHFAVFPMELARRCVLAGTSEKGCCPECGKPWVRDVERVDQGYDGSKYGERAVAATGGATSGGTKRSTLGSSNGRLTGKSQTLGWSPSCDHAHDPVPAVVLDPFSGSGTTAHVARNHQRHAIGIELNEDYLRIAADRLAQQSLLTGEAA